MRDEIGIPFDFLVDIEAFDEGEAEDGAHAEALFAEDVQAASEALPVVAVERAVDSTERLGVASVDGDVELGYGVEGGELVGMLGVADQEAGDMFFVEEGEEFIDVGVEDGFADEAKGAVSNLHGFLKSRGADAGDTAQHFYFLVMAFFCAGED